MTVIVIGTFKRDCDSNVIVILNVIRDRDCNSKWNVIRDCDCNWTFETWLWLWLWLRFFKNEQNDCDCDYDCD